MADIERQKNDEDAFWSQIRESLRQLSWTLEPTHILSPRQSRLYQLALAKVPKFQLMLLKISHGHSYLPIPPAAFEEYLPYWEMLGLLSLDNLEEKYKAQLMPEFMKQIPPLPDAIEELRGLVQRRCLSPRFEQLWRSATKIDAIITYINVMRPYESSEESFLNNALKAKQKIPIIQHYIYSIWMMNSSWTKAGSTKKSAQDKLALLICDLIEDRPKGLIDRWYYPALVDLVAPDEGALRKTFINFNDDSIHEYHADGFFDVTDFPEIFLSSS